MVWVAEVQKEEDEKPITRIPAHYTRVTSIDMSCFGCGKTIPAGALVNNLSSPRCFDCKGEFLPKDDRSLKEDDVPVSGAIPYGKIGLKCGFCGKPSLSLLANGELQCCNDSCSSNQQPASCHNPQDAAAAPQNSS